MDLTVEQMKTCNAKTLGDPDIAGIGVISSFLVISWITVVVALVPAYYSLVDWWFIVYPGTSNERPTSTSSSTSVVSGRWGNRIINQRYLKVQRVLEIIPAGMIRALKLSSGSEVPKRSPSITLEVSKALLNSLCDLQVLTGTAIVVAAAAQLPDISFYHEEIAIALWWVTLNSCWAARIEQLYESSGLVGKRMTVRRVGILVSVILGVTFQVIVIERENRIWDNNEVGRCFLFIDDTSAWPWVVGTSVYGLSLLLEILPCCGGLMIGYAKSSVGWQRKANRWCLTTFGIAETEDSLLPTKSKRTEPGSGSGLLQKMLSIASVILIFLIRQFLSVWSYGDGFYALHMFAYIGFATWNTFDVLSLKIVNKPLVSGENKWGFGQVFPLVMIAAIGLAAFDALIDARSKVFRRKPKYGYTL